MRHSSRPISARILAATAGFVLLATAACTSDSDAGPTGQSGTGSAVASSGASSGTGTGTEAGTASGTTQTSGSAAGETSGTTAAVPEELGTGKLKVVIDGVVNKTYEAICRKNGDVVSASGGLDGANADVVVAGDNLAAVYSMVSAKGVTAIYQARNGLLDNDGKVAGKVTVTKEGDKYSGRGTFVILKIDASAKPVDIKDTNTVDGTFSLTCGDFAASTAAPAVDPSASAGESAAPTVEQTAVETTS